MQWDEKGADSGKKVYVQSMDDIDQSALTNLFRAVSRRDLLQMIDSLPLKYFTGAENVLLTREAILAAQRLVQEKETAFIDAAQDRLARAKADANRLLDLPKW